MDRRTFYGNKTLSQLQEPDIMDDQTAIPAEQLPDAAAAVTLTAQHVIGEKELASAQELLKKYKDGKSNLENRVVEDELWWKIRHWEAIGRGKGQVNDNRPRPTSAWLFNTITNKHADSMDNMPEPIVLPRERSDEESAKTLQSILPVIMEQCDFEDTYSNVWYEKLKHGTGVYGVFWNNELENGLGSIDIKQIDLLKIFWEPGITDIQQSRNLFIVDLVDKDILEELYPELKDKLGGDTIDIKEYVYDESIDTSDKSVVVDWYYKVKSPEGVTRLQFCKFCGDTILYASENDPNYAETGYYASGLYPVVFDVLFPEKSTPCGFGFVAIDKDPQMYIDLLSSNIMETSMMGTKKRFFVSHSSGINEDEFLDWSKPFVHVEGELGEERIREIQVAPLQPVYQSVMKMKIDEMKETSSNRDVNSGGGGSVTAASAIAALQESGNKNSRDMISQSYRSYKKIINLCIELIRQFYDETRAFRITGETPGTYEFMDVNNQYIREQAIADPATGETLYRKPIFDLDVKAQKKSPFSRMEMNERAKELYGMGFFNPERAQEALSALEMMDFEGIDKVREKVRNGQTLLNMLQQANTLIQQQQMALSSLTGRPMPGAAAGPQMPAGNGSAQIPTENADIAGSDSPAAGIMKANTPMTSYGQRLAKRSAPDMNAGSAKDLA